MKKKIIKQEQNSQSERNNGIDTSLGDAATSKH